MAGSGRASDLRSGRQNPSRPRAVPVATEFASTRRPLGREWHSARGAACSRRTCEQPPRLGKAVVPTDLGSLSFGTNWERPLSPARHARLGRAGEARRAEPLAPAPGPIPSVRIAHSERPHPPPPDMTTHRARTAPDQPPTQTGTSDLETGPSARHNTAVCRTTRTARKLRIDPHGTAGRSAGRSLRPHADGQSGPDRQRKRLQTRPAPRRGTQESNLALRFWRPPWSRDCAC